MAYTIVRSDGRVLTTIADGTVNTTSSSIGLPGKNYPGWGQINDTNFVQHLENFSANTPPVNALRGQLWFNTTNNTMYVCPSDGETNAAAWLSLTSTATTGTTTFGNVTAVGNVTTTNLSANGNVSGNLVSGSYLNVTANANIANATLSNATVATLTTPVITTGNVSTAGTLTGVWTVNGSNGGAGATAMTFNTGGIAISNSGGANLYGIKCDNYMWANGQPVSFSGSYNNSNVAAYLPTYTGVIGNVGASNASTLMGNVISTGSSSNAGVITGTWTLSTGSRLQATYADLAERYESDEVYSVGTVVKIGGINEITAATNGDVNSVLGVVSDSYAYLMNAKAGNDETHPAIGLTGRVPVRVIGPINKGDPLVPTGTGCARLSDDGTGFGWALESSSDISEKLILSVIK